MRERAEHCDRVARLTYVRGYSHNARLYDDKARRARELVAKLTAEGAAN